MEDLISILSSVPSYTQNMRKTLAINSLYDSVSVLILPSTERSNSMIDLALTEACWKEHLQVSYRLVTEL